MQYKKENLQNLDIRTLYQRNVNLFTAPSINYNDPFTTQMYIHTYTHIYYPHVHAYTCKHRHNIHKLLKTFRVACVHKLIL